MSRFIEIVVNVPRVSGVFHYHSPPELEGKLKAGQLVLVPFGPQVVQGLVLRPIKQPSVPETRPIHSLVDTVPALNKLQLKLAHKLAKDTLAPLAACVALMLPPGVSQVADTLYSTGEAQSSAGKNLSNAQTRFMNVLLKRGPLRGSQLDKALPRSNWRSTAAALQKKGFLNTEPILPMPRVRPKALRTAKLLMPPAEIDRVEERLGRTPATRERRLKMLRVLAREKTAVDAAWLYAESAGNLSDLHYLAEKEFVGLSSRESIRDPLADLAYDPAIAPHLTRDQAKAWARIEHSIAEAATGEQVKPILLHGVTGSGKTEIYMKAVAKAVEMGRQAIVLVPEIALTPQTIRRFLERFPDQVGLIHSELSDGERYDTWRRARAGELNIIIGPRSALFAPLAKLALIVLDESHDDSFYQSAQEPHYHARRAAVHYAKLAGGLVLMGSATPDVTSRYQAELKRWQLIELPARILAHRETAAAHQGKLGQKSNYQFAGSDVASLDLPPVQIVDMRSELKAGNRSIFSRALTSELQNVLGKGQQAILFLNRRGSSSYVFCRDCGQSLRCPNCENALTQHLTKNPHTLSQSDDRLLCHHCGYSRQMPSNCPQCGSTRIRHYGSGTKSVDAELQQLFPDVRTLRWDRESTRKKGAHALILKAFSEKKADVLVGTQMLAKGLDLPLITLVGVVLADVGLHLPDYRATERVFQVLTQVAGRAGRSPLGGKVILQTFHPDNFAIQAASQHDYSAFYQRELHERRRLRYPPFSNLLRLLYRDPDNQKAQENAESMAVKLRELIKKQDRRNTELIGPVPCYYARINRQYRWQIILRGPDPNSLLRGIKLLAWQLEANPPSLL